MLVWRFTTHHSPLIPHMQYFLSKEAMRCPDKVTALHLLTHRVDFAHAPRCVFSFTSLRPKYVSFVLLSNLKSHRSSLTTHCSPPHNKVPSAACPAASTTVLNASYALRQAAGFWNFLCSEPFLFLPLTLTVSISVVFIDESSSVSSNGNGVFMAIW